MIARKNDGKKQTGRTKENITGNNVSHPNTINFTECLETPLRVQNFGGSFQKGIIGLIQLNCIRFWSVGKVFKSPHLQKEICVQETGGRGGHIYCSLLIDLLYMGVQ